MSTEARDRQLAALETECGYAFADRELLDRALTHRSFSKTNNERLEFLGDAVVNLAAAHVLYHRFPDVPEGVLSRLRSRLVCREALAVMARQFELGALIRLGSGERKSGGRQRDSILADALEALVGAIAEDSDLGQAAKCAQVWFASAAASLSVNDGYDPKTRLQEWLQARGHELPRYEVLSTEGDEHALNFTVQARIGALKASATGTGSSRRRAEQAAARELLEQLSHG
ncbi:MAG: ribonuclease III [Halieaceae bacterium]|nr:ribonuclease III [Halieaceae bacterium]